MIPFTTLLTQPKHAWGDLSASVDRHPRAFVPLWLALPLIPAICLFIGTTQVGWRLPGNDQTQYLSASSGALLARLGFEKEGYAKDYLLIDGQWRDHVLTALTTPDWSAGR